MNLSELVNNTIEKVMEQREEILTAFIAKYKCQPDEIEQVFGSEEDKIVWYVRKRITLKAKS